MKFFRLLIRLNVLDILVILFSFDPSTSPYLLRRSNAKAKAFM